MGDHHNAIVIFVVLLFFYLSALLFKFKLKYKINNIKIEKRKLKKIPKIFNFYFKNMFISKNLKLKFKEHRKK